MLKTEENMTCLHAAHAVSSKYPADVETVTLTTCVVFWLETWLSCRKTNWTALLSGHLDDTTGAAWRHVFLLLLIYV